MADVRTMFKYPKRTTDKKLLALSWHIGTNPKIYLELAPNPYLPSALKIISEAFPDQKISDVTRAVVFAEQDGRYERNFAHLPPDLQKVTLSNQVRKSAEIIRRLNEYCGRHIEEFGKLSPGLKYDILFKVAFDMASPEEVEQNFAQNQRIITKLLILSIMEKTPPPSSGKSVFLKRAFLVCLTISFFCLPFLFEGRNSLAQTQNYPPDQKANGYRGVPTHLKIPKINVDAKVQFVGLKPSGEMDVPTNSTDVGWFDLGPRPGTKGSAVIAGHLDGEDGKLGVFANLDKLKTGDELSIEDDTGKTIHFVVRESRIYDSSYAEIVFKPNDSAHLNLVTCDGTWDGVKKSYSKRLVVFTDIVNDEGSPPLP